jgi:hypothetical protein
VSSAEGAFLARVTSMLSYRPDALLPLVSVAALVAPAGAIATDDEAGRDYELELCDAPRLFRGRARLVRYPVAGHTFARQMPQELAALLPLGAG